MAEQLPSTQLAYLVDWEVGEADIMALMVRARDLVNRIAMERSQKSPASFPSLGGVPHNTFYDS